jgi:cytochrome-b5 reductase
VNTAAYDLSRQESLQYRGRIISSMDLQQFLIAVGVIGLLYVVSRRFLKSPPKSTIVTTPKETRKPNETANSTDPNKPFLDGTRKTVPLVEKIILTHDTRLFRFGLPTPKTVLGLPVGKHFKLYCPNAVGVEPGKWNGQPDKEADKPEIQRAYTPTSSDDDLGHLDLVIKVYKRGVIERFPDGGKASQFLDSLKIGDTIDLAGPFGLVEYKGNGVISYKRKPIQISHIGMIAGGTGITPMLQLIAAVLKNPTDPTKLSLIFANQTDQDILVREQLEAYQTSHPNRFSLWYTLDRPPENWVYSTGFISREMVAEHLPAPAEDTVVLMCGPPIMIERACIPNLIAVGYPADRCISF